MKRSDFFKSLTALFVAPKLFEVSEPEKIEYKEPEKKYTVEKGWSKECMYPPGSMICGLIAGEYLPVNCSIHIRGNIVYRARYPDIPRHGRIISEGGIGVNVIIDD